MLTVGLWCDSMDGRNYVCSVFILRDLLAYQLPLPWLTDSPSQRHATRDIVCEAMYVVFHSNFAAYIVCRRYKPCEFLGLVWTNCWGNKSDYNITSPANSNIWCVSRLHYVQQSTMGRYEFLLCVEFYFIVGMYALLLHFSFMVVYYNSFNCLFCTKFKIIKGGFKT